jgi:hypothetical protein
VLHSLKACCDNITSLSFFHKILIDRKLKNKKLA